MTQALVKDQSILQCVNTLPPPLPGLSMHCRGVSVTHYPPFRWEYPTQSLAEWIPGRVPSPTDPGKSAPVERE